MKSNTIGRLTAGVAAISIIISTQAMAEDWAISATGSCKAVLGGTTTSGGGLKASGGTAVIRCPLTKEGGTNTLNNVYVRMKRASASGADPFCNIASTSNYGTPSNISYGFATDTTANQSVSITLPTQYSYGYADVLCVLNSGDTMYGVRYRQDN